MLGFRFGFGKVIILYRLVFLWIRLRKAKGMSMGRWVMRVTGVHYQRLAQVREENEVTCSSASMVSDTEHGQSEYLDSCLLLRVLPLCAEMQVEDFLRTLQTRLGWRWVWHPLDHGRRCGGIQAWDRYIIL